MVLTTGCPSCRRTFVRWSATRPYGKTDLGFAMTRVTLSLRQLGAEPHTKEVGRDAVYNHHRLRSACRDDGGRRLVAAPPHAGAPLGDVGHRHDRALRRAPASTGRGALLLRSRAVRL